MVGPQPTVFDLAGTAADLSPPVMLVIALLAFLRGWVVLPREIERRDNQIATIEKERDEFKAMTFRLLDVGEQLTASAERKGSR